MSLELTPSTSFPQRRPVLVVIADGVGEAPPGPMNAVTEAATPALDSLCDTCLYRTLKAPGPAVGLPSWDDMGNSEVGHNALGAGRIFAQGAKLVNLAIDSGSMWDSPVWHQLLDHGRRHTLHLLGLHSDGNVHAHTDHLYSILHRAAIQGVTLRVHGESGIPEGSYGFWQTVFDGIVQCGRPVEIDERVVTVLDLKTPGSSESHRNLWSNVAHLRSHDQVKFVIVDREDYEWSKQLCAEHGLTERCSVLFSPSQDELNARELAEWILEDRLRVRFQVQLHKLLWGDEPGR